ncbi:DUF1289 domain-containing protein [Roseomonas indoligenes]|uniref:DUF1289 domain-containing protein n=1 Tax=Roseomonas indoligenes TaxID=2820811 RepID=A0A940MP68_9PROT|nr:DUF1289 domain-containing protein [Pararoseomonas indoligenes]MBP0491403.1 DUF1289 domain-containing protein [Pararoseomonas indoligenes]
MSGPETREGNPAPPSPCIGLCRLDEGEICQGCGRSIGEIAAWPSAGEAERRAILARAAGRRSRMQEAG